MLIHAAYFLTRQTLFQFSIGHVSVLRNERKRKISGHPDNVLAPRKSTGFVPGCSTLAVSAWSSAPARMQLGRLQSSELPLAQPPPTALPPGPRPDVSVAGAVLASRLATVDAVVASPAVALVVARPALANSCGLGRKRCNAAYKICGSVVKSCNTFSEPVRVKTAIR